jgi:hypothetical protein
MCAVSKSKRARSRTRQSFSFHKSENFFVATEIIRRARDRQESRARRLMFYSQRSPQEEASGYLPATTFA